MAAEHIRVAPARWAQIGGAVCAAFLLLWPRPARAQWELCTEREPVCLEFAQPPPPTAKLRTWLNMAEAAVRQQRALGLSPARRARDGAQLRLDGDMLRGAEGCAAEIALHRALLQQRIAAQPALPTQGASLDFLHSRLPRDTTRDVLSDALLPLATPCALGLDDGDWVRAQREPAWGWPHTASAQQRSVAGRFLRWLDHKLGAKGPGRYLSGVLSQLHHAELFTVLRENSKNGLFSRSDLRDAVAEFGLLRFRQGAGEPSAEPAWRIDWPRTPRALLLPTPLTPLGSAAVLVQNAPASAQLRVEIEWEQHAELRLAALVQSELTPRGRVIWPVVRSRVPELNVTLELDDAPSTVLLVLTSVGDPHEPLDSRLAPFEAHGVKVTLAAWGASAHAP